MAKKAMTATTAKAPAKVEPAPAPKGSKAKAEVAKIAIKAGAKLAPAKSKGDGATKKVAPFVRKYQDSQKLVWQGDNGKVNPRSPNTKDPKNSPHSRYAAMMGAKTVGEALKRGAWSGTISRAVKEGRLLVK
jgi:hypothetical protein